MTDRICFSNTNFDAAKQCGYKLAAQFMPSNAGAASQVLVSVQVALKTNEAPPLENANIKGRGGSISVLDQQPQLHSIGQFELKLGSTEITLASVEYKDFKRIVKGRHSLNVYEFRQKVGGVEFLDFANFGQAANVQATSRCSVVDELNRDVESISGLVSWATQCPQSPPPPANDPYAASRLRITNPPFSDIVDPSFKVVHNLHQGPAHLSWDSLRTSANSVLDLFIKQMGMGSCYGFKMKYKTNNSVTDANAETVLIDSTTGTPSLKYMLFEEVSGVFAEVNDRFRFAFSPVPPTDFLRMNAIELEKLSPADWEPAATKERVYIMTDSSALIWPTIA